mmetsp:Transcript_26419/g.57629  ORF Transcript_26419/g.57629 Transcript_26419/m.57629 type:complete len:237 (+) Transcript_26419:619-1329(+)
MNVLDAVLHDAAHRLEALEGAHGGHCVALHQDVALCEQLDCLEGGAVGADQALPPLHKLLLVADDAANLDDVALHVIIQDLESLGCRHTPGQQLDKVAGLDDDVGVVRLAGGLDGHGALNQVEFTRHTQLLKSFCDCRPHLPQVFFAVLWEQRCKGALFQEPIRVIVFGERKDSPMVDALMVPWLVLLVLPLFPLWFVLGGSLRIYGNVLIIRHFKASLTQSQQDSVRVLQEKTRS